MLKYICHLWWLQLFHPAAFCSSSSRGPFWNDLLQLPQNRETEKICPAGASAFGTRNFVWNWISRSPRQIHTCSFDKLSSKLSTFMMRNRTLCHEKSDSKCVARYKDASLFGKKGVAIAKPVSIFLSVPFKLNALFVLFLSSFPFRRTRNGARLRTG